MTIRDFFVAPKSEDGGQVGGKYEAYRGADMGYWYKMKLGGGIQMKLQSMEWG